MQNICYTIIERMSKNIMRIYQTAKITALSDGKQGVTLARALIFRAIYPYAELKLNELKQFKAVKN